MISVPWQCGQCRTCMIMTSLDEVEGCSDSRTPEEHSRPTPLKHLRLANRVVCRCIGLRNRHSVSMSSGATTSIPSRKAPVLLLLSLGKQYEQRGMRAQKVTLQGPCARPPTPVAHSCAPSRCSCGSHRSARPPLGSEN